MPIHIAIYVSLHIYVHFINPYVDPALAIDIYICVIVRLLFICVCIHVDSVTQKWACLMGSSEAHEASASPTVRKAGGRMAICKFRVSNRKSVEREKENVGKPVASASPTVRTGTAVVTI